MAELAGLLILLWVLLLVWAWVVVWIARAMRKPGEGRRMSAEWLGWIREGDDWELRFIGNWEDGVRAAMEEYCRGTNYSAVLLRESEGEPEGPSTITDAEIRGILR